MQSIRWNASIRHNDHGHPSVADSAVAQDAFNDRAPRPLNTHPLTIQASVAMLWRVVHLQSKYIKSNV